jgi:hypothetical protein
MSRPSAAQPYTEELKNNSNELKQLVGHINELLGKHADLARETSQAIVILQERCAKYFSEEEKSTLLHDASENAPWLTSRVEAILHEHSLLREQIAVLKSCTTRQQPLPLGWSEFSEYFACFKRLLFKHEQTENQIWRDVYMQEVGTKD